MVSELLVALAFLGLISISAVLATSHQFAERMVAGGLLPRAVLSAIPAIRLLLRACGVVLILAGITKLAIDAGWLTLENLTHFGLTGAMILGGILVFAASLRSSR